MKSHLLQEHGRRNKGIFGKDHANTVAIVLLWMMVNVFIGIYKGYRFF